ncbi:ATP-binding protein [Rhodocyclus purpureus]|uniref:ATP-binding protein n=1 Tax=Rhodocyclus purpureus TaxID=1067 RepID=UPI0019123EFE|nr:ATP-binding protein [Rhodocyclus purpureus]MBK5915234.1 hypothetical protein [Rhodocyclus purpureus]
MPASNRRLPLPSTPWLVLALTLLVIAAIIGFDLLSMYRSIDARERERLVQQAETVGTNLSHRLQSTSNALDALRDDLPWLLTHRDGERLISQRMQAMVDSMTGVRTLFLVDVDGKVLASNRVEALGQNIGERPLYQIMRRGADPGVLYLSPPVASPLGGITMTVGKLSLDHDGKPGGYVVAAVDPEYFKILLGSVVHSPDTRSWLIHGDGGVLFTAPANESVLGRDLSQTADGPFARFMRSGEFSSIHAGIAPLSGENRLFAFRSISPLVTPADQILVSVVSRDREAIFAPWYRELAVRLALFALLALGGIFALLSHQRRQRAYGKLVEIRERERAEAETRVRESEGRLRRAAEAAQFGVFDIDLEGGRSFWSAETRSILGVHGDVPVHEAGTIPAFVHPDDVGRVASLLESLRDSAGDGQIDLECRAIRPDGSMRWVHIKGLRQHEAGGEGRLRDSGVVIDITERKQAEEELRAAKEAADAATRAKSAFLANMSHEIRTPLNAIVGNAELLRADSSDPMQKRKIDRICEASGHLLSIINDILDLSKIESGQLRLEHADFELAALVERVLHLFEEPARGKGLALTGDVAPDLRQLRLQGDALRLAQVLINLGSNAIKFTERGEVRLAVVGAVDGVEEGERVRLRFSVSDTGCGIAAPDQAGLFRPFTQVDASATRRHGGTGLGLAISQRLVGMMGGRIEVDSAPGSGSVFRFELLLARAVAPAGTPQPVAGSAPEFADRWILLAEDQPLNQEILRDMLVRLGCRVDVAGDGVEAVERARSVGFDLILMDVQMPRLDGLAATRVIRALPGYRDVPIIALTASVFAEDRQLCLDAGMNAHLGKPVTPDMLARILGQWLPGAGWLPAAALQAPALPTGADGELAVALRKLPGIELDADWLASAERIDAYRSRLQRFIDVDGDAMARCLACLDAGDGEGARRVAHSLKGIAGMLGVRRVAALAGEIELCLRQGAADFVLRHLASECQTELASLAQALAALPTRAAAAS